MKFILCHYVINKYIPVKFFRRVMHNFRYFSPVLWHYRRHVIYRRILYTIQTEKWIVPLTWIHGILNWSFFWKIANMEILLNLQGYMLIQYNHTFMDSCIYLITFVGLEKIEKDIHFGDCQVYFSVCMQHYAPIYAN